MRIVIVGAGAVGSYLAERLAYEGQDVVVIENDPVRAQQLQESVDCLEVARAERAWVAGKFFGQFQPLEAYRSVKGEVEFVVIEHMENSEVMATLSQQLQAFENSVAITE